MMKKLVVLLFVAVFIMGFANQETTHASIEIPKITSIQPVNFVTLSQ